MAQVRNTATGQVLTIPDDQLYALNSQWQVVGPAPAQSSSAPSSAVSQAVGSTATPSQPAQSSSAYVSQAPIQQAPGRSSQNWVARLGNAAVFVNGELHKEFNTSNVRGDMENANKLVDQLANQGHEYVGTFNYDVGALKTWAQQHGYRMGSSSSPAPEPGATTAGAATGSGVDQSGWTESMKQAYEGLKGYVDLLAQQGLTVNPSTEVTPELAQKFLDQAKNELGPYYGQLISQAQQDAQTGYQRIIEDYNSAVSTVGQSYGRELESLQEDFASTGRTFSSQRDQAERRLADSTSRVLADTERNALRAGQDLGTTVERYLGSKSTPSAGSIPGTGAPILGQPGMYGLSSPGGSSRQLYSNVGNVAGELERNRTTTELLRQKELIGNERTTRAFSTL